MIFPYLLTDIICPLIVKRVFTGDVCTALISTVLAGGGHAKAWPSLTLSCLQDFGFVGDDDCFQVLLNYGVHEHDSGLNF